MHELEQELVFLLEKDEPPENCNKTLGYKRNLALFFFSARHPDDDQHDR